MGNEARCRVSIDGETAEANVSLETEELIVRGAMRAKIPFRDARDVAADGGVLRLLWDGREVRVHVGADAPRWVEKIRNPKTVADKLGLKAGQTISVIGSMDESFLRDRPVSKRLCAGSNIIFFAANARADLDRLPELRDALDPAGAIWVIRPKGVDAIRESDVLAAGKKAGLVDVKVVKFSDTHTAEKLVIPVASRRVTKT
jgi:hypothetical protein